MRELKNRGVKVHCIDANPAQPAFRSIYGFTHLCPNPDQDPDGWVRFMLRLADQIGGEKIVLISSSDMFISALGAHAQALSERFLFCRESIAMQALLATKKRQYDIAADHGLPTPLTRFVCSEVEVEAFSRSAAFPVLLKPLHFREWRSLEPSHPLFERKIVTCANPAQLLEIYRIAAAINPEAVLQEIIAGPDDAKLCYLSCYSQNGQRLGWAVVRQIRTDPIYFGSASLVEPIHDPETADVCDRFLRSIGYAGICEIELKRDSRDGIVKLIEANPRYSLTSDAAYYMGVELGWLHYLDLIGQHVQPVSPNSAHFRHIALFRDLACIPSYFSEGLLTWRALRDSYRKPCYFFDFDPADRALSFFYLFKLFRIFCISLLRYFFPKRTLDRL